MESRRETSILMKYAHRSARNLMPNEYREIKACRGAASPLLPAAYLMAYFDICAGGTSPLHEAPAAWLLYRSHYYMKLTMRILILRPRQQWRLISILGAHQAKRHTDRLNSPGIVLLSEAINYLLSTTRHVR